ncbi:MAG: SusC/RagA family TonB-linked outer membrane protein, partial [Carboxylicivirga sp.]|nr:SusC/RagA family TonB-linked outer membrane protein [Carboxylicivirga sp.]
EAIPGVSVVVRGTTIGTVTNVDGNYSLSVPDDATNLLFSFVGMTTQDVVIEGRTTINVKMVSEAIGVAEVVVTGVGAATDKRKVAISVESVNADDLTESGNASVDQAIAGKIPGARVQSVTGQPGQQQSITLRGINSLSSSMPMVLVDGVQINMDNNQNGSTSNFSSRFADLDLADVERVEVVQGAAAATIYGAQGANGVIQIFTKKGKKGQKPQVLFNSRTSIDSPLFGKYKKANRHYYNTDSQGYIVNGDGDRLAQLPNGSWQDPLGEINSNTLVDKPFMEKTYDHLDQTMKSNAVTYYNNLQVSGGGNSVTYMVSGSILSQESTINGKFDKYNLKSNIGIDLLKNLKLNVGSSLIYSDNTTGTISGIDNRYSPLGFAVGALQYIDLTYKDSDGNFVASPANDNSINPLYSRDVRTYSSKTLRTIQNLSLNYKINKFVTLDAKYGYDTYRNDYDRVTKNQEDFQSNGLLPNNGEWVADAYSGTTKNFIASAYLNLDFENDFGWSVPLKSMTMFKYDWRQEDYARRSMTTTNLPKRDDFLIHHGSDPVLDGYESIFRTYGYLVNQKFEYGDLLGFSGGLRVDWSSAFGEGSEPFVFPRGDFYLRLSELDFFENMKGTIAEWKVRTAYGQAGIQPGPFDRIITLGTGSMGSNTYLVSLQDMTNPALDVQVSKEFEVGTDVVFTPGDNWLSYAKLSFVYWDRDSEDVIWSIQTPPSGGSGTILDNAFTIESDGIQIGLDLKVLNNANFKWNSTINYGKSKSIIASISNKKDIALGNNFVLKEGYAVGAFFGLQPLTSLDQTDGEGNPYIPVEDRGDYVISSDGYVTNLESKEVQFTTEKVVIGDPTPDFNLSWINTFDFSRYASVSVQLDWVSGFEIYNQTRQWLYRDLVHEDVAKPVTIGDESKPWAKYYQSQYNTNEPNAAFVEDGSYLRLKDLSVTLRLNEFLKLDVLKSLDLTLAGRNLFTITDYSGFDPEAASVDASNTYTRGLDQYAFPNSRTYSIGLRAKF